MNRVTHRYKSATTYVLMALIPYSDANLKLSFAPKMFFSDLSSMSKYRETTLRTALRRAEQHGYISKEGGHKYLTSKGKQLIAPYTAAELGNTAKLMIIFDIPEDRKAARQKLRMTLRARGFTQEQRSVWTSQYDYRDPLSSLIAELEIKQHVKIFEALEHT